VRLLKGNAYDVMGLGWSVTQERKMSTGNEELARMCNYRPYSELSQHEKDQIAEYLKQLDKTYGSPSTPTDPAKYWWKYTSTEWDAFNVNSVE
jgi:hypothetical protein